MTTYTEADLFRMVRDGSTTAHLWEALHPASRERARDLSDMSPQLEGMEGWRVEVTDTDGNRRRFIVGKSTGWRPCHLELFNRRSHGGSPASKQYATVRKLEKVR